MMTPRTPTAPSTRALAALWASIAATIAATIATGVSCVSTTPPDLGEGGSTAPTPDAAAPDSSDAAGPTCTVAVAAPGNELGVGMYCLAHQNQCKTGLFCSADYVAPSDGFCTKLCSVDADCGSGMFCYTYPAAQGGVSVCVPLACRIGDAGPAD